MPGDVRFGSTDLIRFEHVGCAYGSAVVIEDVTFVVTQGEFVGIVGPSGGGKTTVLRALLGTIELSYGLVARQRDTLIGYVSQVVASDGLDPFPSCAGSTREQGAVPFDGTIAQAERPSRSSRKAMPDAMCRRPNR